MSEIQLTPNYANIFRQMLNEAKNQSDPYCLFSLPARDRAEALRAVQRFLAPLNIAAQCMTDVAAVETYREALAGIVSGINLAAGEIEEAVAEDDAVKAGDGDFDGERA